jgi:hypothetical protein
VNFFPFKIPGRINQKNQRTNSPAQSITREEQLQNRKDNRENNCQYNPSSMEKQSWKVNRF